jgi:hypothetical protein
MVREWGHLHVRVKQLIGSELLVGHGKRARDRLLVQLIGTFEVARRQLNNNPAQPVLWRWGWGVS